DDYEVPRRDVLVGPRRDRLGRPLDEQPGVKALSRVGRRGAERDDVEVLAVERRREGPLGAAVPVTERRELVRTHATLGRAHEQVTQLVTEGALGEDLDRDAVGQPKTDPLA